MKDDFTGFFRAVRSHQSDRVERYLSSGMSANAKTQTGRPVLHMAISPEVIRLLVKAGADIEARDQREETALESACNGDIAAVQTLIGLGANVNALHDRGYSTLMTAVSCMRRTPEIVQTLIDYGADPLHVTELGFTPLHAWIGVPGQKGRESESEEILKILLAAGVDLEAREGRGFTALLLALSDGSPSEALMLLRKGADPHKRVEHPQSDGHLHSSSTLMLALRSSEVVGVLLQAGVDPHATDENGHTALWWARAYLAGEQAPDSKMRESAGTMAGVDPFFYPYARREFIRTLLSGKRNPNEVDEALYALQDVETYDNFVRSAALLEAAMWQ